MTFNRVARAACIAVTLGLFGPMAARADSAADLETARMLLKEGNALREKGDLRGALAKYKAAHSLVYTPITGLEVGRTHLALGELVEARESFLAAGRMPVKALESQNTTAARVEADRLAIDLEPRIPTLTIFARGPGADTATITLDDQPLPSASIGEPRKVNPGAHRLVAHAPGAQDDVADVVLAEREKRTVTLTLIARDVSVGPSTVVSTDAGPRPNALSPAPSPFVYVGFGVAAAGVVVGTITGVLTLSKASSLSAGCPQNQCGPSRQDDLHSARTFGTVSTVSFAVAGAGAIVGIVSLFSHSSNKPTAGAAPGLVVGVGTIGFDGAF